MPRPSGVFPTLSIIIPTYNGIDLLRRCLTSVCQYAPDGTEIIVVDDASTDKSSEMVQQCFPQVRLIQLSENQGFCRAINAGLHHAVGELVELLNNDTQVLPGWAHAACRHFQDPSIMAVAPLVLRMDDSQLIDSAGIDYHLCGWATERGHGRRLEPKYLEPCEVFGVSASSGFYRRSALVHLGGLLPEYGAYLEDVDLALRMRRCGYRSIYEPASRVLHRGHASYGQRKDTVERLLSRNEEYNFWMNLPAKLLFLGLLPHLGFLVIRFISKTLKGQLGPFLRGKLEALANWRLIRRRRFEIYALNGSQCIGELGISRSMHVVIKGLDWILRKKNQRDHAPAHTGQNLIRAQKEGIKNESTLSAVSDVNFTIH